jgi:phosphoribosyl-ATP pyrophosphohydrolase
MIIPSIDLSGGKVVQWRQGREPILERRDAEALARRFGRYGEVALIDLDAAVGGGENTELIRRLCALTPCRVGGGIRTVEAGRQMLKFGARRIIISTKATPDFLSSFPRSQVMAAVDVKGTEVVDHGWQRVIESSPGERISALAPYVSGFVYTMVDREGTLQGADMERFRGIAQLSDLPITVAGGVTTVEEVAELDKLGLDCQVGMAIYTERMALTDAFVQCIDFEKGAGVVPALVSDSAGRIRMQGWMNHEALKSTLDCGSVHFWSRTRKCIWRKGDKSGNVLEVRTVRADCDRDSIHVIADPRGPTCHTGRLSCFGDDAFALGDLESVLLDRVQRPFEGSWTSRLAHEPELLRAKLLEEAAELAAAVGEDEIAHEAGDLLYHTMALLAVRGVSWSRVLSELNARQEPQARRATP